MMRTSIFIILFIAIGPLAMAQNRRKLDSMFRELPKVKSDTTRIHLLINLADEYLSGGVSAGQPDSADLFTSQANQLNKRYHVVKFQRSIDILSAGYKYLRVKSYDAKSIFLSLINVCQQTGDIDNELKALDWLLYVLPNEENNNSIRISCYQRKVVLFHKLNRTRDEINALKYLADLHLQQRKYAQAETELFRIIQGCKRPIDLMHAYDLLGAVYIADASYDKGLFYVLKAMHMMQLSGDSSDVMTFYGRLIMISNSLQKPSLTVKWAKKGLDHMIQTREQDPQFFCFSSYIVRGLIDQGKADSALAFILHIKSTYRTSDLGDLALLQRCIGSCYYALGKYTMAERSYLGMIRLINQQAGKNGSWYLKSWISAEYQEAGDFYIKMGNYNKARGYLLLAIPGFEHDNIRTRLKDVHLSLFRVDSALGNYKSAMAHLQQSTRINDSMFTVAKNKQIEELQIQYQTAEKDKNLKLAQNKAKLEQVQLDRNQNTRNWIIAGSGLLLVIASLLYRQSRLRKKNNNTITQKNAQLQNLVTEKEWLLKEVHHRVKNNLHSVICLLEAQAAYLHSDALQAIENSQHRIYTMSLIHQKLYQSDDVKTIDMSIYIPELVQYLRDSFDDTTRIHFQLAIAAIQLNASQAIPLALIINEGLTNSIKYAFPCGRSGEITISLTDTSLGYKLEMADNGIGMDRKKMTGGKGSLGLELMKGLAKEIRGEITIENNNGVSITIVFDRDLLHSMDQEQVEYLESI